MQKVKGPHAPHKMSNLLMEGTNHEQVSNLVWMNAGPATFLEHVLLK